MQIAPGAPTRPAFVPPKEDVNLPGVQFAPPKRRSRRRERLVQNSGMAPERPLDEQVETPFHYDSATILLHWGSAILIACLWVIGQTIGLFPNGPLRVDVRSTHITLGILLMLVLVLRLTWRGSGRGAAAPPAAGLLEQAATVGHWLLYALIILAVASGLANFWIRGGSMFNLFTIPSFSPDDRETRRLIGAIHSYATNGLVIVALGHAAMALLHRYVLRDDVLGRMLPGARSTRTS
jgi:cytochrome b561